MQLRIEVFSPEIPVFVAQSIRASVHARRTQDLMGELVDRCTSDATTNRVNERLAT